MKSPDIPHNINKYDSINSIQTGMEKHFYKNKNHWKSVIID